MYPGRFDAMIPASLCTVGHVLPHYGLVIISIQNRSSEMNIVGRRYCSVYPYRPILSDVWFQLPLRRCIDQRTVEVIYRLHVVPVHSLALVRNDYRHTIDNSHFFRCWDSCLFFFYLLFFLNFLLLFSSTYQNIRRDDKQCYQHK